MLLLLLTCCPMEGFNKKIPQKAQQRLVTFIFSQERLRQVYQWNAYYIYYSQPYHCASVGFSFKETEEFLKVLSTVWWLPPGNIDLHSIGSNTVCVTAKVFTRKTQMIRVYMQEKAVYQRVRQRPTDHSKVVSGGVGGRGAGAGGGQAHPAPSDIPCMTRKWIVSGFCAKRRNKYTSCQQLSVALKATCVQQTSSCRTNKTNLILGI